MGVKEKKNIMKKSLPRLLYFDIQNLDGKKILILPKNRKSFINVAIDVPDDLLDSRINDGDFSIYWIVNGEVIQHDDIPIQEMLREKKRILRIKFELDAYQEDFITLRLSLGARYSELPFCEQLNRFSFFETIIRYNFQKDFSTDSMGVRPVPSVDEATKESDNRPALKNPKKHKDQKRD